MAQLVFDCRTCIFCRKKRAYDLATRCVLHASLYDQNCFLTLTYDESKPGYHNKFHYRDIQIFKKKLRRYCDYHFNKKIQIFNVHEYGKNGKKHWHLVLFNHDFHDKKKHGKYYTSKHLEELWPHGFNTVGDITEASAMYTAQYVQKDIQYGNALSEKKSHSKHSGIGRDYFLKHYKDILRNGFIPFGGKKLPITRYFQKLAHKHYSYFYAPENFLDYNDRKRLYTHGPFWTPNKEIADLYKDFEKERKIKLAELEEQWNHDIEAFIFNNEKPDFMIAAENHLYDLKNKQINKNF